MSIYPTKLKTISYKTYTQVKLSVIAYFQPNPKLPTHKDPQDCTDNPPIISKVQES